MMEGMRYERGGKGKYWIPKPGEANARTPLLSSDSRPRSLSPQQNGTVDELDLNDEELYESARRLEFGDWNYPVITAHEASRERWMRSSPGLLTTSTNRNLLQPTRDGDILRASNIKDTVEEVSKKSSRKHSNKKARSSSSSKGKQKDKDSPNGEEGRAPTLQGGMLRHHSSASSSAKSDRSQLVDLIVEDAAAEDAEVSLTSFLTYHFPFISKVSFGRACILYELGSLGLCNPL